MKDLFEEVEVLVRGKSLRERDLHRGMLNLDLSSRQGIMSTTQIDQLELCGDLREGPPDPHEKAHLRFAPDPCRK